MIHRYQETRRLVHYVTGLETSNALADTFDEPCSIDTENSRGSKDPIVHNFPVIRGIVAGGTVDWI